MMRTPKAIVWFLLGCATGSHGFAQMASPDAVASDRNDVRFTQSATNSSKREVQRRLGYLIQGLSRKMHLSPREESALSKVDEF